MDFQQFGSIVNEVYDYFNTKAPSPVTIKLWYVHCQSIPVGEPLRYAAGTITGRDSIPRNFAKALWDGYETWRKMNADRIISDKKMQKGRCDYCGSTGFIFSSKIESGVRYKYVSRCPKCRNWIVDVTADFACFDKEALEKNGFVVEGYRNRCRDSSPK